MPDQEGMGCGLPQPPFFPRPDIGQHSFSGSNTWVLKAVRALYPDSETGLTAARVDDAIARNVSMLERASDLTLSQTGGSLVARIINQTGHKLPTGFPDGRRMWVNVKFLDAKGEQIDERGAYDFGTGTLVDGGADTTIYECLLGIDATQAALTGMPEGMTFHIAIANEIIKDNRIPPRGFILSAAEATNSLPVGADYISGQNFHDSFHGIPFGARQAVVTVYYQVTTREFIEFLRDANQTDSRGDVAYDQWVAAGMSPPVVLDSGVIDLCPPGDIDEDGLIGFNDLLLILSWWGDCPAPPFECPFDLNNDGFVNFQDLLILLTNWGLTC